MNEPIKLQVLPDEHIAEEATVSADELFSDIMAGFGELESFVQGETLRVTEYVDGKRQSPADLTMAELKARQQARGETAAPSNGISPAANGKMHNKNGSAKQKRLLEEIVLPDSDSPLR